MPKKDGKAQRVLEFITTTTTIGFGIIKFLIFIFFAVIIIEMFGSIAPAELKSGNVAVIPLEGIITSDGESTVLAGAIKSQTIIDLIEKAEENEEIKAILLEIDSPGGTPVATDEIAQAVKRVNKTIVAVIRESGASGAYWIASAADTIFANRMSVTGSIGVTSSRLEFGGLLSDYNVTYRRLVAGTYKDIGTRYREMTPEEQQLYQKILDKLHAEFIKAVAENRKMPEERVREMATGMVYLGIEAKELGLVDELGNTKDALKHIEKQLNITAEPVTYSKSKTFFEELSGVNANSFYHLGRGIASTFTNDAAFSLT